MTVTVEGTYQRTTLRMLITGQLTEQDLSSMVGWPLEGATPDQPVSLGIVSSAQFVEGGRAVLVTVENGGRACALCGDVYHDEHIYAAMRPVWEYRSHIDAGADWAQVYAGQPDGAVVCAEPDACARRVTDAIATGLRPDPTPGR